MYLYSLNNTEIEGLLCICFIMTPLLAVNETNAERSKKCMKTCNRKAFYARSREGREEKKARFNDGNKVFVSRYTQLLLFLSFLEIRILW